MNWFVISFYLFIVCAADDLKQKNGESKEQYYTRILARHTYESNDEYEVRVAFLQPFTPDLPIWKNYDYLNYITVESNSTHRPPYVPKYLDDITQKTGENSDEYYKRIFKWYHDENDYEYMERISILRGLLNKQDIWINNNFMYYVTPDVLKRVQEEQLHKQTQGGSPSSNLSNGNSNTSPSEQAHKRDSGDGESTYTENLKQRNGESKEDYYTRILMRHTYESNDEFEVRIAFLQPLTPNLPIWKNYEYLKYITVESNTTSRPPYEPKYLEDLVKKKDESSDQYYKRIFEMHSDENDYQYMERVAILRGLLNKENVWIDNNFMTYVKPHILKSLQKKQSSKRTQSGTTSQENNRNTFAKQLFSNAKGDHTEENNNLPTSSKQPSSISVSNGFSNGKIINSPSKTEHKTDGSEEEEEEENNNLPTSSKQPSSISVSNGFSNGKIINSPSKTEHKTDGSEEEEENKVNDATDYSKGDGESLKAFCMRVFAKRPFETDTTYRITIKRMMEMWLPFEMWREKCKPYVDLDALLSFNKYKRLNGESKAAYCRRLFEKRFYETDDKYKNRISKTKARFSEFNTWQQKCEELVKSDNSKQLNLIHSERINEI